MPSVPADLYLARQQKGRNVRNRIQWKTNVTESLAEQYGPTLGFERWMNAVNKSHDVACRQPCCFVRVTSAKETRERGHISCHGHEARTKTWHILVGEMIWSLLPSIRNRGPESHASAERREQNSECSDKSEPTWTPSTRTANSGSTQEKTESWWIK